MENRAKRKPLFGKGLLDTCPCYCDDLCPDSVPPATLKFRCIDTIGFGSFFLFGEEIDLGFDETTYDCYGAPESYRWVSDLVTYPDEETACQQTIVEVALILFCDGGWDFQVNFNNGALGGQIVYQFYRNSIAHYGTTVLRECVENGEMQIALDTGNMILAFQDGLPDDCIGPFDNGKFTVTND